jgi:hypothetical protein
MWYEVLTTIIVRIVIILEVSGEPSGWITVLHSTVSWPMNPVAPTHSTYLKWFLIISFYLNLVGLIIGPLPSGFPTKNCLNPLNAELNHICHFQALLGAHHILHVSWIRVNVIPFVVHVLALFPLISSHLFSMRRKLCALSVFMSSFFVYNSVFRV